jgi:RNA polymerase sigma-70 factor (ECF subfamily)
VFLDQKPDDKPEGDMSFNQNFAPETRDYLCGFARRRLSDSDLAEDVVQETLLSAFRADHSYAGQSSERTWLVGVLKHKIIDHLRRDTRNKQRFEPLAGEEEEDGLFDAAGRWKAEPSVWNDPWRAYEQREFWRVLRRALDTLPPRQAQAFWLREVEELTTEQVCNILGVTTTNALVMLHRARLRLMEYLEIHWFGLKPGY